MSKPSDDELREVAEEIVAVIDNDSLSSELLHSALLRVANHALTRVRDETQAEVERLREDKERLDWLEAHPDYVLDCNSEIWCCYPETTAPDNYQGETARAAIDTARAIAEREPKP